MLCILSFVIFLILFPILGFFPEYRQLFRESWSCVIKKATFQPCDINMGEKLKGKLLGKLVFKYPKIAKFLSKTFSFWAGLFVVINIASILAVANTGLNLWVWDTCEPFTGESCSMSGEACGVGVGQLNFIQAVEQNKLIEWSAQPFTQLGETVSRIPDKFKNWQAKDYLPQKPSYYLPYDSTKPTSLEVIDPSCQFCKKLFENIKKNGFQNRYNLTYISYPIPSDQTFNGYKFAASDKISAVLEAAKDLQPVNYNSKTPADWKILETIFVEKDATGTNYQSLFNSTISPEKIQDILNEILKKVGYNAEEIVALNNLSKSETIRQRLEFNRNMVENTIKTRRIPTIIFDGKRYDRVIDEQLK